MKAGVIGTVDGEFKAVSSFTKQREKNGTSLNDCLEITGVFSLPTGERGFQGHAVRETLKPRKNVAIQGGAIQEREEEDISQQYTQFVGIPGEFVVTSSSKGSFAFDLIESDTGCQIERASVNVDGLLDDLSEPAVWKAGFANSQGPVNGVLYGEDLLSNGDFGSMFEASTLNQIGMDYTYLNESIKMTATESGYIEVYQPSSFGAKDFLQYLESDIAPYIETG